MSNVITLSGPNPTQQIVSQFLDQFNANNRSREQARMQQAQLDQQAQQHTDQLGIEQGNLAVNQGQLKDMQDKFALVKQQYGDQQLQMQAKQYVDRIASYHDAIQSMQPNDPQRAALEAQAKAEASAIPPELLPYVKIATLEPILTPQRQAGLNANKFAADSTGRAAAGGTAPNDVNMATKIGPAQAWMPSEGFQQQQAVDLAARDAAPDSAGTATPDLSRKIPTPSGNAISDYEARATSAMPTAPQNLNSQTQITTQGMQDSTQLKIAAINASKPSAGSVSPDDAKAIAAEIIAGRQPPHIEARIAGPVRGALAAQHYDLTKAAQDWAATQKYLSTMNGAGQVRLRQAVDFAYESLGVVDDLAKQWEGGGFPLLNKARLFAAKQGVMGPQAQAIATKLESQIVEMQAELAVVYRGGNSPTDEAMKQAGKVLQTDWSLPTLRANLGLLSQNLLIRRNSIVSAGAATGAGNNYAPNVTIAPPGGAQQQPPSAGSNPLGLTPPGARP